MNRYIVKRILQLLTVFFGISFFTFALISSVPYSNPLPGSSTADSFILRYFAWLRHVFLEGNAMNSGGRSGFANLGQLIPHTVGLACVTLLLVVFLSLLLGILTAVKKDSPFDYAVRFFTFLGLAIPNFVFSVFLIFTFCLNLKWFGVIENDRIKAMVLPVCALSAPLIARYVRQVRGAVLDELNQDYVIGATARGVGRVRILCLHVLPNAMTPILSSLGVVVGHLLGGIAIIEVIFIRQGIGAQAIRAILTRNYNVIQVYVLWMALLYVAARFFIDILVYLLDPQLRRKGAA